MLIDICVDFDMSKNEHFMENCEAHAASRLRLCAKMSGCSPSAAFLGSKGFQSSFKPLFGEQTIWTLDLAQSRKHNQSHQNTDIKILDDDKYRKNEAIQVPGNLLCISTV